MILSLLLILSLGNCGENQLIKKNNKQEIVDENKDGNYMKRYLTTNDFVQDIVDHPAFEGFGELLLTSDNNSSHYNTPISNIASLMPYHNNIRPNVVLGAINRMVDDVNNGKTIFYDIYSKQEQQIDPAKKNTGIFFYRGKPDAPFAVVCPGGGFSYVGSLHEGFPLAQRISELGFNAFVIRYRIGSEHYATEDLAEAITYIINNAEALGVNAKNYSIWGGSAGARMAGNIALGGVSAFGGGNIPKPVATVLAYTGQSSYSDNFTPSFITIAANDRIANVSTVDKRVEDLRNMGVNVEYQRYKTAGHGFGLGTGTDAEGWLDLAVNFWERQITK